MLTSLAWRNLSRNRRRSAMTGFAVATAVVLLGWMVGFTYGAYDEMISRAVHTRVGHLQVLAPGYLEQPSPEKTVPDAASLVREIEALPGVRAASARAVGEGLLLRDGELVPADLVGVLPEAEARATIVPAGVLSGERAVAWCRRAMPRARAVLGGDEGLFDRWCAAAGQGRFPSGDAPREVAVGRGLAERLLVSVGDEVTVQAVRAVSGEGEGAEAGGLVQRRLVVAGILAVGSPEVDQRAVYLNAGTLEAMLGTGGPNEVAVVLDGIEELPAARARIEALARARGGLVVHGWDERHPSLAGMIAMAKGSRAVFFVFLGIIIVLSVANTTLMSVLERTRELGVMLALGMRRGTMVRMIATEVALLGLVAVLAGAAAAAGVEAFGRLHGYPLQWVGWDPETYENMAVSGVGWVSALRAKMPPAGAVLIVVGIYATFQATGLWAAWKAYRLRPVDAMRSR